MCKPGCCPVLLLQGLPAKAHATFFGPWDHTLWDEQLLLHISDNCTAVLRTGCNILYLHGVYKVSTSVP